MIYANQFKPCTLFEAVLKPMLTDTEQIAILRKISESNRSLAGLLDISRLDSGVIQAEPDYFSVPSEDRPVKHDDLHREQEGV